MTVSLLSNVRTKLMVTHQAFQVENNMTRLIVTKNQIYRDPKMANTFVVENVGKVQFIYGIKLGFTR